MTSATLLDQDFGSESEDDNFNPAPADDSDNDAAGESETEVMERPQTNGPEQTRRSPRGDGHDEDDDGGLKGTPSVRSKEQHGNGHSGGDEGEEDDDGVAEGEDHTKPNGAGQDDEDEEEDEEDEDDEEEEVSVCPP